MTQVNVEYPASGVAPAAGTPNGETSRQLLDSARRLSGEFLLEGDAIERNRRIPPALSRQMAEAGFYRLFVPRHAGGLEADPATGSRIFETLARGDASCGWIAFIAATSGMNLAHIPREAASGVFSQPTTHIAGVFAPTGKAECLEDGFRVTGRWQWGSGTQNADWILCGCQLVRDGEPVRDEQGAPAIHMMMVPARSVEFLDTWHVSGLCGTGSTDFQVDGVHVPAEHAVGYLGEHHAQGPLYQFPVFTFLALGIGAVAMGIARAAIDDLVELARSKQRAGNRRTLAEQPHSHMQVATAEARLRAARAFYYDALAAAWEAAQQNKPVPIELRRNLRLATTHAVNESVAVVDAMYTLAGGSAVYQSCRLQRLFRDIHVATQHIMVAPATLETAGRLFLGVDANVSML
jgi:alkylation response protein AidB-like acyl-CoA dehydrogenase